MKVDIGPYPDRGKQKVKIKIDKWDTWGMDDTLALLIVPMLKQLKKTKHGAPWIEGYFDEKTMKTKPSLFKAWDKIMDKMIWSFEAVLGDDDWKQPRNKVMAYNKRVQEGLDLFGKYYRDLWD